MRLLTVPLVLILLGLLVFQPLQIGQVLFVPVLLLFLFRSGSTVILRGRRCWFGRRRLSLVGLRRWRLRWVLLRTGRASHGLGLVLIIGAHVTVSGLFILPLVRVPGRGTTAVATGVIVVVQHRLQLFLMELLQLLHLLEMLLAQAGEKRRGGGGIVSSSSSKPSSLRRRAPDLLVSRTAEILCGRLRATIAAPRWIHARRLAA